ncbi:MAG: hypothetical protein ACXAEE_12640 [Candidatus Thorarchaeota archaeon]
MTARRKYKHRRFAMRIAPQSILFLLIVVMLISPMLFQMQPLPDANPTRHPRDISQPAAEDVFLNLTYWSRTNSTIGTVSSGDKIGGDHVMLNATWTPSGLVDSVGIEVNATAIPSVISNSSTSNSVQIDTRSLGNNGTCTINATVWLLNGSIYSKTVENVFIGNFFTPRVTVLTPNGGETWIGVNNVTWDAWDTNRDESLTYEVLMSFDSGVTFQSIASNLNKTWYLWDCSECPILNTYLIEVSVTDGIYYVSDRSDANFTAGGMISPTTTPPSPPSSTSTTTPPPNGDPRVATFLVLFVVSSGIMALVVYYAAKKWF